jgi:Intracellular proteinase inhibitor
LLPNRLILPLLCAASVAFARGSLGHSDNPPTAKGHTSKNSEAIGTTLHVSVSNESNASQTVSFALHVANNTKKMLELRFPSGQTHEFVVLDASGREVWRWSRGKMFTQAIRNKLLKGREETVFEDDWSVKGLTGTYTAIATLRSENHPIQTSVTFVLP